MFRNKSGALGPFSLVYAGYSCSGEVHCLELGCEAGKVTTSRPKGDYVKGNKTVFGPEYWSGDCVCVRVCVYLWEGVFAAGQKIGKYEIYVGTGYISCFKNIASLSV